jgi:hypothetical protein
MKWTDEQIEQLKELWEQGKSDEEIAEIMHMSRQQVNNKRRHLGWQIHKESTKPKNDIGNGPMREFSRTTDMLLVQFLADGYSLLHIAYELHRDLKTLKQYIADNHDRLIAAADFMLYHYDGLFAVQHPNFDIKKYLEGEKELCLTR